MMQCEHALHHRKKPFNVRSVHNHFIHFTSRANYPRASELNGRRCLPYPADWRAVCGRSACTVRREGRRKPFLPLSRLSNLCQRVHINLIVIETEKSILFLCYLWYI
jgi:hypothetical protein